MSFPVDYPVSRAAVFGSQVEDASSNVERNYAQTTGKLYGLTDEQFDGIYSTVMGAGFAEPHNHARAQRVIIHGETVEWLQRRGNPKRWTALVRF